ncbi:membrane protein [Fulvitalea axinellae]|uniref:Membrane protein n=1 Tax=Fulvitalea axinellae TaxID=1182444 RepID=A0AAU9CGH1_9BACT|nr:membrane protein [Fulvitalea axinellae]
MKNIKAILLFASLFASFGCSDWLRVEPDNVITRERFWKSEEDVNSATIAVYAEFSRHCTRLFEWGEARGDMVKAGEKASQNIKDLLALRLLPTNGLADWYGMYRVINLANSLEKYAPQTYEYDASFTEEALNEYLAEARYMRALSYFYLVRTFQEVPLVLEPSDTDDVEFHLAKSTEEEVFAQIIKDLVFAERYAKRKYGNASDNKGRATKSAVQATLADVYLWTGQYAECQVMCDKIISRSAHVLMPKNDWFDIFFQENTSESVFEIQYDSRIGFSAGFFEILLKEPQYLIGDEVEGLYTSTKDVRKNWIIQTTEDQIRKVVSRGLLDDSNWVVYRYADILLMKAEALIQEGSTLKAQQLLNDVRKRAGIEKTLLPSEKHLAEDVLLEERAREFAFEGKRWYDILRMAHRDNYARKDLVATVLLKNVPAADQNLWISKLSNPQSFYFPIHIEELRRNPALVQNPYYEN